MSNLIGPLYYIFIGIFSYNTKGNHTIAGALFEILKPPQAQSIFIILLTYYEKD